MENGLMKIDFTDEQVKLIKTQIAPKATDDELKLFLYQAKRTGLDPLARQIYCVHRSVKDGEKWIQKMTVQTSIDGFRVIAERSGDYAGQDEPEFIHDLDKVVCAKVKVYRFRGEQRYCAAVGVAYWSEYVPKEGQDMMWKKMPHTMLSKVAEALALRKAYPQDLSGLYTNDEMNQADETLNNNHKETEQNGKAPIKNGELKAVLERLAKGDVSVYGKALERWSFEATQKSLLDEAYIEANKLKNAQPQTN